MIVCNQSLNIFFIKIVILIPIKLKPDIPKTAYIIFVNILFGLNNHSVIKVIIGSIQVSGITPQIPKIVAITETRIIIAIEVPNISPNDLPIYLFIIPLIEMFYGNDVLKLIYGCLDLSS